MTRHETPSHGPGIEEGLAARLCDPLWLLGRQWQLGEFRHENAASPARVEIAVEIHTLDEQRTGDGATWQPYDVSAEPLERRVEEHGGGPPPRLRLEGGLRLKRLLAALGHAGDLAAFTARCPFAAVPLADAADARIRAGLPDGAALEACLARLADDGSRAAELAALRALSPVAAGDAELAGLAASWVAWWRSRAPAPISPAQDCWEEHRMEHAFALRATSLRGLELRATAYPGGRLDWLAVDAFATGALDDGQAITVTQHGIPAPARFGGMPAARFWEMEDARFDPGSVDAAPIDLGRLMLVAYATIYGNDWFVTPIRAPVASLLRVTSLDVHDVYGRTTALTEVGADQDGWSLFALTAGDAQLEPDQERPTSPWFFLPPALPASLEGPPSDVALLFRDEMANVAWAVEAIVADDAGRAQDRFAAWAGREVPAQPPIEIPAYRVQTEVPTHWFPLVPDQLADQESIRLALVPLTRLVDGEPQDLEPTGTLLPSGDRWLYEEEVPRSGVELIRTWQQARWHDGSRHLWQARRRSTGRGEGSSALRFDVVEKEK